MVIEIRPPTTEPADWSDRLAAFIGAAGAFGGCVPNCVPIGTRASSWTEVCNLLREADLMSYSVTPLCFSFPATWRWEKDEVGYGEHRSFAHISRDGRVWVTGPHDDRASARFRAQAGEVMARRWEHVGLCQAVVQDSEKAVTLLHAYAAAQESTEFQEDGWLAKAIADSRLWLIQLNRPPQQKWEAVLVASGAADVPLIARWLHRKNVTT